MQQPKVLVTGATGKTGSALVAELRRRRWPVRALVHRHDARSMALASLGAEVVAADLNEAEQLLAALRGVQRAYYVPPFQPHGLHGAAAFAAAAKVAKPEAVVLLSQWLAHPNHPSVLTRELWLTEQLFSTIPGVAQVVLDPGMFADNFLRLIDFASLLGIYPVFTGDSRSAPVANEDVARVAAAVLTASEPDLQRHAGQRLRPTGPALLSGREMAAVIARVLERRVRPLDLPFWMFRKATRQLRVPVHEVANYRHYVADHQLGAFSLDGGVTDVVSELTGTPAETFETTTRRYAALPYAQPTMANRIRAIGRFAVLPLHPAHDLAAHESRLQFPRPTQARLASEDPRWLAEHQARSAVASAGAAPLQPPADSVSGHGHAAPPVVRASPGARAAAIAPTLQPGGTS